MSLRRVTRETIFSRAELATRFLLLRNFLGYDTTDDACLLLCKAYINVISTMMLLFVTDNEEVPSGRHRVLSLRILSERELHYTLKSWKRRIGD